MGFGRWRCIDAFTGSTLPFVTGIVITGGMPSSSRLVGLVIGVVMDELQVNGG